jgi:hypothetical protein
MIKINVLPYFRSESILQCKLYEFIAASGVTNKSLPKKPIFAHLEATYKCRLFFRQVCTTVPRRQCAKLTRQECKTVDKPFTTQVMHRIFIEKNALILFS